MVGASYFAENASQDFALVVDETIWDGILTGAFTGLGLPVVPNCIANGGAVNCGTASELATSGLGDYDSRALYTDISWALTEQMTINAGLRYSRDHKDWGFKAGVLSGKDLIQRFIDTTLTNTGGFVDLDTLVFGGARTLLSADTQHTIVPQEETWTKLTPRLAIDYAFGWSMPVQRAATSRAALTIAPCSTKRRTGLTSLALSLPCGMAVCA